MTPCADWRPNGTTGWGACAVTDCRCYGAEQHKAQCYRPAVPDLECDTCGRSYPGGVQPHPNGGKYCVVCWPRVEGQWTGTPSEPQAITMPQQQIPDMVSIPTCWPTQPPPRPGAGDVLGDLVGECGWAIKAANARDRDGDRGVILRQLLDNTIASAARLCRLLGVDLKAEILRRREKGIATYGQPLQYGDGRTLGDAAEELIDAAAYLLREMGPQESKG